MAMRQPSAGDRPTLRMVAAEAGVSVATVSYVLSGRHRNHTIKDSTADRVREAATRLGYRRNDAARAIRTGKSDLVLLSLSVLADPWSQAVAETVSAAVSPLGKTALIVADGDWRTVLSNRTPDVIFIDSVSPAPEQIAELEAFAAQGVQIVAFSETLEPRGFDVIRSGAEPRCHLAVEHLLEHHDRVGALTSKTSGFARYDAYVTTMRAAGRPIRDEDIEIFERHPRPGGPPAADRRTTGPRDRRRRQHAGRRAPRSVPVDGRPGRLQRGAGADHRRPADRPGRRPGRDFRFPVAAHRARLLGCFGRKVTTGSR
jgi:DNA-binding LacI/PurR family transcriptional regulator